MDPNRLKNFEMNLNWAKKSPTIRLLSIFVIAYPPSENF